MAWVEFKDGSKTQYNVRSVWKGANSGIVRGSEYPPGAPVTVEASYQASADEGGQHWRAADHVKIFSKQPIPGIVPPPPKPRPVGQTRPPIPGPGGGTRQEYEAVENGSDTDFGQESPPAEVP
jgi:hypothetical protein